jgi:hypothetical protein
MVVICTSGGMFQLESKRAREQDKVKKEKGQTDGKIKGEKFRARGTTERKGGGGRGGGEEGNRERRVQEGKRKGDREQERARESRIREGLDRRKHQRRTRESKRKQDKPRVRQMDILRESRRG